MQKIDIRVIIGTETYVHKRITFDQMREIDWNEEIVPAIIQAEYDNKE